MVSITGKYYRFPPQLRQKGERIKKRKRGGKHGCIFNKIKFSSKWYCSAWGMWFICVPAFFNQPSSDPPQLFSFKKNCFCFFQCKRFFFFIPVSLSISSKNKISLPVRFLCVCVCAKNNIQKARGLGWQGICHGNDGGITKIAHTHSTTEHKNNIYR